MADAVAEVVTEAGWKLRTLLRTQRYYTDADLIVLYKSHVLSYLEYRTPAVYHATRSVLDKLDEVQRRFLRNVGVDEETARLEFNLAPLEMRRDIAMLGVIQRAAIKEGPPQLQQLFQKSQGGFRVIDPFENVTKAFVDSVLCLGLGGGVQPSRQRRAEHQDSCRFPKILAGENEKTYPERGIGRLEESVLS